jgi:hypothetical protein
MDPLEPFNPFTVKKDSEETFPIKTDSQPITNFDPQPSAITYTSEPETNQTAPAPKKSNLKKILLLVFLLLVLSSSGVWAFFMFTNFEKYAKPIPILSLLPNDPNFVLIINSNPDSEQINVLEKNLQKFPGYQSLTKDFSNDSSSKSFTKIIQDKLKKYNIDFDQDFRNAFSDKTYVVINDLSPLGNELQKNTTVALMRGINSMHSLPSDNSSDNKAIALNNNTSSAVLGDSTEKITYADFVMPTLTFQAATEIKDLSRAKKLLEKIQQNTTNKTTKNSYNGYDYYVVETGNATYSKIYNALIGKNWIVASDENDLKNSINIAKSLSLLNISKQKNTLSLADNEKFKSVNDNLKSNISGDALVSFYLKLNFEKFLKPKKCEGSTNTTCDSITSYIKYPQDIVAGFDIRSNQDGIGITMLSNKQNTSGIKNSKFINGMVSHLPAKVDNRFTDVLFEYSDPNNLYYSFKQNNLTEKGLEEYNKILKMGSDILGINFEADIVDQLNGESGFALFTAQGAEPEGVLTFKIKDTQKTYAVIEKIITTLKTAMLAQFASYQNIPQKYQTPESKQYGKEINEKIKSISNAKIIPTITESGTIYSFKIPDIKILSFDFSIENNELLIGSHYNAVKSLLDSSKNKGVSLSENVLYKKAQSYSAPEGYSQAFIVSQGIVNIIDYVINNTSSLLSGASGVPNQENELQKEAPASMDDSLIVTESILKTIKFLHTSQSVSGEFFQSATFFNLEALPQAEKDRAEKSIEALRNKKPTSAI